jgi:hypothetical protein
MERFLAARSSTIAAAQRAGREPPARRARPCVVCLANRRLEGSTSAISSEDYQYLLPVSAAQVYQLMQSLDGSEQPGSGALRLLLVLAGALADIEAATRLRRERVSQSLVQGVLVLSPFAQGEEFGVTTTGWRRARTSTAMGVLEQTSQTHRYRLARTLL